MDERRHDEIDDGAPLHERAAEVAGDVAKASRQLKGLLLLGPQWQRQRG